MMSDTVGAMVTTSSVVYIISNFYQPNKAVKLEESIAYHAHLC